MMNLLVVVLAVVLVFIFTRRFHNSKVQTEVNIKKGQEYLDLHKDDSGVTVLESGMLYQVLREGTGTEHPTPSNKVSVHYHGTLIDGTVFDSSVDRGQTIDFFLSQVIPGWTEGLQQMVVGEKARLSIPSHLAYGNRSVGTIPGGSLLIFDVELFSIS